MPKVNEGRADVGLPTLCSDMDSVTASQHLLPSFRLIASRPLLYAGLSVLCIGHSESQSQTHCLSGKLSITHPAKPNQLHVRKQ